MGIYINMEIPEKQVHVILNPNGLVEVLDANNVLLEEYQAVPVPPHGDLIDAQEEMRLMQSCDYDTYDDYSRAFDMLDNAPTIIPAEEVD